MNLVKKNNFFYIVFLIFLLIIILIIPIIFAVNNNLYLNQFFLQRTWIEHGSIAEIPIFLESSYPLGLRLIFDKEFEIKNITDEKEVLEYIFYNIPYDSYVYPTETYYYYRFFFEDKLYAGNLRLLDAQDGKIHIGYYDFNDPHGQVYYKVLNSSDGIYIEQVENYTFRVNYKNIERIFHLSSIADKSPEEINLLSEEEFIAHIIDESGIRLFLIYNNETKSFYYLLDEEEANTESFYNINTNYLLGKRTNYVFYFDREEKRKILVGVSKNNIYQNDYYDGPFDQLPPRLPLKEKLEAAYPYVKYAGGIDAHGNFYGFEGSRVAISPYLDYSNITDLMLYHLRCNPDDSKSVFWSCLSYEWKKDFHKTLEEQQKISEHIIYISQGWPSNHQGNVSIGWNSNHWKDVSSKWTPNHLVILSSNS